MNKLDTVYAATLQKIQELDAQLHVLRIKKATLEEIGAALIAAPLPRSRPPAKPKEDGQLTLPGLILAVLGENPGGLSAAALRDELKKSTSHAGVDSKYLRKTLKRMVKMRRLESQQIDGVHTFKLFTNNVDAH